MLGTRFLKQAHSEKQPVRGACVACRGKAREGRVISVECRAGRQAFRVQGLGFRV